MSVTMLKIKAYMFWNKYKIPIIIYTVIKIFATGVIVGAILF